jgi:hypothetical protein
MQPTGSFGFAQMLAGGLRTHLLISPLVDSHPKNRRESHLVSVADLDVPDVNENATRGFRAASVRRREPWFESIPEARAIDGTSSYEPWFESMPGSQKNRR